MEQLGFDAINLVKRYKLAWIRAMENRIPDQEVIAYVNGTYESMKTNYKLSGNTICNGIEDAT